MLVINEEKKLLLGERIKRHGRGGIWQFPQGGVEPNLSLEENVIKELTEELGAPADKFQILKKLEATHQYDFDDTPPYAVGRWRGQRQTFWLVRFMGTDSDFKLDAVVPEFTSFQWCTIEEVKTLAEPKRLPGYLPPLVEVETFLGNSS